MAVNLSPVGGVAAQFFDNNGVILSGGKIYTYAAGTTTNQATYTSSSGGTAHPNPIILDSAGRVPSGEIWLTDGLTYKFVIKTSAEVLIGTYDNIIGINSNFINFTNEQEIQTATAGQTVFTLTTMEYQPATGSLSVFVDGVNQYGPSASYAYVETSSTVVTFVSGLHVGASVKFTTSSINASSYGTAFDISYTPPFTASVATNVGDKLAQMVSVMDFGAVGDGTTNDTVAIQAAITASTNILVPTGNYLINTNLTVPAGTTFTFETGGKFTVGTGITITWNGGINANPYQQIFAGNLVQSAFISGATPPYTFGVQGTPQIEYSTPCWFGAVGNDSTNCSDAIDCWLYFGKAMYLPSGTYLTNRDHVLKRSNVRIYGDGKASVLHGTAGTSALLGLSGVGVGVQSNVLVEDLSLNASNVAGYNAIGVTYMDNSIVRNIWFTNCGHYAYTIQYYSKGNIAENLIIESAASAVGSTRAAISCEGTATVFTDVQNNIIRNVIIKTTGGNAILVYDTANNLFENIVVDAITGLAASGLGNLIRVRGTVSNTTFSNILGKVVTGYDISTDATVSGCFFNNIISLNSAKGVLVLGTNNKFFGLDLTCSAVVAVPFDFQGSDNIIYGSRFVGLSATDKVLQLNGDRNSIIGGKIERPNAITGVILLSNYCSISGATITGNGAGAIRFNSTSTYSRAFGNAFTGTTATLIPASVTVAAGSVNCNNVGDTSTTNSNVLFGYYELWVDATGDLRINSGPRSSDTGGTVVGTQT